MRKIAILFIDVVIWLFGKCIYLTFYLLGWRFISRIGKITGDVIYLLSNKRRKIIEEELVLLLEGIFEKSEIRNITKRSFENYYMRRVETMIFGRLDEATLNKIMNVEGLENLDAALSDDKGVILLLSHFGSFLLPLPFLGYKGYKINQVTGEQKHSSLIAERLWRWRKKEAERLPVKFIQVGKFLRPIYKALRNNEIVAIAFDGRDGSTYNRIKFLNRTALISLGPINLTLNTGAIIVPTFVVRRDNFTHKLILGEPIRIGKIEVTEANVLEVTKRCLKIFTEFVATYPCHCGVVLQIMKEDSEKGYAKPFFLQEIKEGLS